VWQGLHEEFQTNDVDVVAIGIEVEADVCHQYMDKAPDLIAAGLSLIDPTHATVGALNFRNVPMALWVNADGTIALPAHHSPVTPGWGDRAIPEGLPPRIAGRFEVLKAGRDRHQEYLAVLRRWVQTGEVPDGAVAGLTADQARAIAAFELGDHLRLGGDAEGSVACWRASHELDPDNWSAKRQAWSLVTSEAGAPRDLMQEDTGPYDGNWLDDVVSAGGIDNYYPSTPW
jgi:hypothetical protein